MTSDERLTLIDVVKSVRAYKGVKRKADIGMLASLLPENVGDVVAAKGEDGAIIKIGKEKLAFAADGIITDLCDKRPEWAGYCSILVNFNDMLAMNATPLFAVNVVSARDRKALSLMSKGMKAACEKFGILMVGGHLHPDAESNAISVAMVGRVEGRPLLSTAARPGDKLAIICDCTGSFTPGVGYSWDCTSSRTRNEMSMLTKAVRSALSHFSSGKDISNPGTLGTIAMLLESSRVGAEVDLAELPVPAGVDLTQWLTAYQGMGFVGSIRESRVKKAASVLKDTCLSMAVVGEVDDSMKMTLRLGESKKVLFDLSKKGITGLFD